MLRIGIQILFFVELQKVIVEKDMVSFEFWKNFFGNSLEDGLKRVRLEVVCFYSCYCCGFFF